MGVVVLCWAVLLSGFDICFRKLPNWLTIPAAVVACMLFPTAIWGGFVWAALYVVVRTGKGDVKLALSLGTVLAASSVMALFNGIIFASFATVAAGIVLRTKRLPHGPSMLLGSYLAWLLAQ